ncbi:MAG: SPOR domain-containing protein [Terriglobales bacterium]
MVTTASQDTEITLGTGRMLALFFALVALCGVVFGLGFSAGRSSVKVQSDNSGVAPAAAKPGKRPSATNSPSAVSQTPDMSFYKSVGQDSTDQQLSATPAAASAPNSKDQAADANTPPQLSGYFVQVAAVSKQEDAEALVEALKKKQFSALASQTSADKLFHVQVGPFADIKDAESMRSQLLNDGYNPIVKK